MSNQPVYKTKSAKLPNTKPIAAYQNQKQNYQNKLQNYQNQLQHYQNQMQNYQNQPPNLICINKPI